MVLEDCINYLLTGAQHKVYLMMKKALEPYGLTPVQYGVLACIWQNDLHNPKDIALFLSLENSTISGILDRMEDKQLIERTIDSNDRRYIQINLTDKTREMEKQVLKRVDQVNQEVMKGFSDEEAEQFRYFLRLMKGDESEV